MKNIYVCEGDRFLCQKYRDDITSSLLDKSEWETKTISEPITASKFTWTVNSKEVFGSKNKIFIIEDIIPDPSEDIIPLLENLPKSRVLIFLFTEKEIDKRTKLGKFFSKDIKQFPTMFNDKGYLDQKQIEKSKPLIREITGWSGSDICLDFIMEKCDYEYGSIINEIYKINTFLGKDPESIDEIKDIICMNDLIRMEPIFDKIKSRDLVGALELAQDLVSDEQFKNYYMMFFLGLLDNFNFMMYCNMAKESGRSNLNDIVSFVSENYTKSGKKVPPQSIQGRFFFVKDYLDNWSVSDLQMAISKIESSINASILNLRSERFIVENFLAQIV